MFKTIFRWIKDNLNEITMGFFFLLFIFLAYHFRNDLFIKTEKNTPEYENLIIPMVAFFGIFMAWLQYIFTKYKTKKEAAITFFPKHLELATLEKEVDEVINFWSRKEALENYEVRAMFNEKVEQKEYELIWDKLSFKVQKDIAVQCINDQKAINEDFKINENFKFEEFNKKYVPYIIITFKDTQKKLNIYLNQIETYCSAINSGVVDLKASMMFSVKFTHHFKIASTYINKTRENRRNDAIYEEFEIVIKKWKELKPS